MDALAQTRRPRIVVFPLHSLLFGLLSLAALGAPPPVIAAPPGAPQKVGGPLPSEPVPISRPLAVSVSDPDGDSLTVRFFGRSVAGTPPSDFTLIGLPDTQFYTAAMYGASPGMLYAQTSWTVAQRVARNIRYAVQLGDCVEHGENAGNPIEWARADTAFRMFENPASAARVDGLPYGMCVGNHDQLGNYNGRWVSYERWFGAPRFAGRDYYGGHWGAASANWFELFDASGCEFIVIGLDFAETPNPPVLHWADSLLKAYPSRLGIVASHYLLEVPTRPDTVPAFSALGAAAYDSLKDNPNLRLLLAAHLLSEARRSDVYAGRTVHSLLSNYQGRPNGGDGRLRILEFSPARGQLRVRTYSPWTNSFETDADSSSQFTLPFDFGTTTAFEQIGSVRVASNSQTGISWPARRPESNYEWYVTADDGQSRITSATWNLVTAEVTPPVVHLLSPNGGGVVESGGSMEVRWTATDNVGVTSVNLQYSKTGAGGPWLPLASNVANTGALIVTAPSVATANAFVRVLARDAAMNTAIDASDQPFTLHAQVDAGTRSALEWSLGPATPNPARDAVRFDYALAEPGGAEIEVFDPLGRRVAVLATGVRTPGRYSARWDGASGGGRARPGLYVVRLRAGGRELTRRFVWLP